MQNLILILAEAIQNKQPSALVTVVDVKGVSPAKIGAHIVLVEAGYTAKTVGGGRLEDTILNNSQAALV
jgi:xanthine/CO dehydrogenase XdhC/CoxF family maturation factor